jgi:hypothetical protein
MTVIPLPSVSRGGGGADGRLADWTEPRHFARSASGLVHDATGPLLAALIDAIATAADRGVNDTGARAVAETLRDARLALDSAITTAGRTLADREVRVRPGR